MPVIEPWSRMSVRQQSSLRPRIFPHGQNDLTPLENLLILTLIYSFLYSQTLPPLVSLFLPLSLFLLLLFHLTSQTPPRPLGGSSVSPRVKLQLRDEGAYLSVRLPHPETRRRSPSPFLRPPTVHQVDDVPSSHFRRGHSLSIRPGHRLRPRRPGISTPGPAESPPMSRKSQKRNF